MKQNYSRRSFVGIAAASAGALALAGCAPAQTRSGAASGSASAGSAAAASGEFDKSADLIVIGSGAAGMAGAARAAQGGASVIVLEASSMEGGTTAFSGGHYKFINDVFMSALPERNEQSDEEIKKYLDYDAADFGDYAEALTTCQKDIEAYLASDSKVEFDSIELWLVQHYLGTKGEDLDGNAAVADYDVVAPAYYNQGEVYDWMSAAGITFSEPQPFNRGDGGPLSVEPDGKGAGLLEGLRKMAVAGNCEIITGCPAISLISDDSSKVVGVVAKQKGKEIRFGANKAVLLATGGFGANPAMVAEQQNCYKGIDETVPTAEAAFCTGTGIEMAQDLGASVSNMAFVQFYSNPTGSLSAPGWILCKQAGKMTVNINGERFDNDSERSYGGSIISKLRPGCDQPGGRYFVFTDAAGVEIIGDQYDGFKDTGVLFEGDTLADVCGAAGLPAAKVEETIAKYNSYVDAGEDPDFGRTNFEEGKVEESPFVVVPMSMYVQNTMGGVTINSDGHVVNEQGEPIEGLYAAGEVTGNLDGACRRHGDNFAQILYYGWLCGKTVAEA